MVSITIEDLTRAYLNLRTERSLLSQKFKEEDAELVEAQNEIKAALAHHELIKVKVNADDRDEKSELISAIEAEQSAELVQKIGHVAVFFKRNFI